MPTQGYNLSREVAARLIDKSVRTLDRYLKTGKIRYIKTNGRTWLSREDVLKYAKNKDKSIDNYIDSGVSRHIDSNDTAIVSSVSNQSEVELINKISTLNTKINKQNLLLKKSLDTINTLKTRLSQSITVSEHNQKIDLIKHQQIKYVDYIKKMDLHYKSKSNKLNSDIKVLNDKYNAERLNKNIISFILGLILVLHPILIYFL
jgi:predicted site-specific integrase-resolvase